MYEANATIRHRSEGGFTISEVVLVMVVFVALIVVVVTSLRGLHDDAAKVDCSNERRRLLVAAEQYRAERDRYPADVASLERQGLLDKGEVTHLRISGRTEKAIRYEPVDATCR